VALDRVSVPVPCDNAAGAGYHAGLRHLLVELKVSAPPLVLTFAD
jgi:hypothetical protein